MLKYLSWRNLAMFLMALVVTSLLILGSVILAVDRLLYANADCADEQPAATLTVLVGRGYPGG